MVPPGSDKCPLNIASKTELGKPIAITLDNILGTFSLFKVARDKALVAPL